ncbi:MAG: glutathione S-transferase family protein [Lentilitoribacter sp.]
MNDFHLISHHLCPYVQRAVIVLSEKAIEHKRTYIDLSDKPDWFAKTSPLGRVPILKTQETVLFESQVIAEYLDEITQGSLHPENALTKAHHRSWIEFGSETLAGISGLYNAKDFASFEQKRKLLRLKFERINVEIEGPYFAGEHFHMIDGVWATIFRYFDVFDKIANFEVFTGLEKVENWRQRISQRKSVQEAPPEGYNQRLEYFLQDKSSYISGLMTSKE